MGSLLAGSAAAVLCMTLVSPIQRVKLLLQTQAELVAAGRLLRPYEGVRDCFRRVVAEEGLLSLWRGNVAHLLRVLSANAIGFALKDRFKKVLHVDKVCNIISTSCSKVRTYHSQNMRRRGTGIGSGRWPTWPVGVQRDWPQFW
jgi:hypothetical protein